MMARTQATTPRATFTDPEQDELEHVLRTFMKIETTDNLYLYVTEAGIKCVNNHIDSVEHSDEGKDLRFTKDGSETSLSDPQRGRLIQLRNFQRYYGMDSDDGYFEDWESLSYTQFNQFRSRRLSGTDPPAPV